MDAKKCDRCGDFFNTSDNEIYLLTHRFKDYNGNIPTVSTKVDLCKKCSKKFDKFMGIYLEG